MIENTEVEKLLSAMRTGVLRVDLDHVRVCTPTGQEVAAPFPFYIQIENGQLRCHWRVPSGSEWPAEIVGLIQHPEYSFTTPNDHYRVIARSSEGLSLELEGLSPFPSVCNRRDGCKTYSSSFERINVLASGSETLDSAAILEHLSSRSQSGDSETRKRIHTPTESLFAVIAEVELLIVSGGTETVTAHPFLGEVRDSRANCLSGDLLGGQFCVEGRDGDLYIYYRRKIVSDHNPLPTAAKVFEGILSAIGLTHGCHPWPFYSQHIFDEKVTERWLKCSRDCARDALLPIQSGAMTFSQDARALFHSACTFFAPGDSEAELMKNALWLMRDANRKGMAFEIRLITLCSIVEGLFHWLTPQILTESEFALKPTRSLKWQVIGERLGIPWENVLLPAFKSWDFYRHSLAHGFKERSDEGPGTKLTAHSRLSAAIYLLMARRMGYVGMLSASILEGKTVHVPVVPKLKTSIVANCDITQRAPCA